MRVWLVTIGEELPATPGIRKARTALLADSLVRRGHDVLWWTSTFDHFQKRHLFTTDQELTIAERYRIHAIKGIGYKKNISLSRIADHRVIAWRFSKRVQKMSPPDLILAAMPSYDLAWQAVKYANEHGIPVLLDIRDQWPDIFFDHVPKPLRKIARLFFTPELRMLRKQMQQATGIIAMMDSLLEWGLRYAGRSGTWMDRVFYLGFSSEYLHDEPVDRIVRMMTPLTDRFIVTFFGTFGYYHNPSVLIECAKALQDSNIHFVIAGDGELMDDIKSKAAGLANVTLPGWLNQHEIITLLKYSNVGACTTPQYAEFFPNKAFVYLSAGLPLVSSFQGDIKTFIEEHQIGFYYPPNDAQALCECLKKLCYSKENYMDMSARARNVYVTLLDAKQIYDEYGEHLENICRELRN